MKRRDLMEVIEQLHAAILHVKQEQERGEHIDLSNAVRELIKTDKTYAQPALDWWESEDA